MSKHKQQILLISEDYTANKNFGFLTEPNDYFEFLIFSRKTENFDALAADCILLDVRNSGFLETLDQIAAHPSAFLLPIVVLIEKFDENLLCAAFKKGVRNFLVKGEFTAAELFFTLRKEIEISRLRRAEHSAENKQNKAAAPQDEDDLFAESEARFQLAFAAVQSVIYDWDVVSDKISRSAELVNLLGFDNSEKGVAHNRWWLTRLHPDDAERAIKVVRDAIESGAERFEDEYRMRHRDGHYVWVRDSGVFLKDADGKITRCIGSVRNIDHRKQAEFDLQMSEERLSLAMQGAQIGAFDWNIKTGEVNWSRETEESALMTAQDFDASFEGFLNLVHPHDRELFQERVANALESGEYECEFRMLKGNGEIRWVIGKGRVLFDADGSPARMIGVDIDITKRKIAEEQLRESQRFTERIIETAPSVVYLFDIKTNRNTYLTAQAAKALGYSFEEIKTAEPNFMARFMHSEDAARVMAHIEKLKQTENGETLEVEYRMRHSSGEWRWFRSRDNVFRRNDKGEAVEILGIALDITERKIAEERLRDSQLQTQMALESANTIAFTWEVQKDVVRRIHSGIDALPETEGDKLSDVALRIIESDRQNFLDNLDYAMKHPNLPYRAEYRVLQPDHQIAWLSEVGRFSTDDSGALVRLTGISSDITERKRLEQQIREQFDELENIYRSAPIGLGLIDRELRFTRINERLAEINGVSVADHIGRTIHEIVPQLAEQAETLLRRIFATGEPVLNVEITGETKAQPGVQRIWNESWYPIKNETGETVYISVVVEEITERKTAEEKLRESEERLSAIMNNTNALIYMMDAGNRFLLVNRQFERLFGLSIEKVCGKTLHEIYPHEFADTFANNNNRVAELRQPHEFEEDAPTPHGVRTYISLKVPQFDTNGDICGIIGISSDITERKTAEEKLRASEEQLKLAVKVANFAICEIDYKENTISLSEEAARLYGIGDGALTVPRTRIHEVFHPDERETLMPAIAASLDPQNKGRLAVEHRVVHPNGDVRWLNVRKQIFFDETQNPPRPTHGILVAQDITKRRQAEEKLRASEEFNRKVLENSPDCVKILDTEGKLQFMNANGLCLMEIDDFSRFRDQLWWDLWTPESETLVREAVENARGGKTSKFQAVCPTAKGTLKWWDVIVSPIAGEDGKPSQIISVSRDITDSKKQEAALRRSEERYRALVQAAAQIEWTASPDGNFVFAQPSWEGFTGQTFAEYGGNKWTKTIHPDDREQTLREWKKAVRRKTVYEMENRLRRRDGVYRWMLVRAVPILDENGEIREWIGTNTDITTRKEAEQKIRESEKRLRLATQAAEMFSWEKDLRDNRVKFSETAAQIIGCGEREISAETSNEWFFLPLDEQARVRRLFENELAAGQTNFTIQFSSREDLHWQAHGLIMRDERGNPFKVVGVTQNVTERKLFEEKLQTANFRFRVSQEAAKGFNYEWNLKTNVVTRSESIKLVLGYSREELATTWQAWADLLHPDDLTIKSFDDALSAVATLTEEFFTGEYRVRHKDGHYIWMMERGLLIRDENGKPHRIIGQTMDITERKEAQEKLLAAERRAVADYRNLLGRIAPLAQSLGTARELLSIYRALLDFIRVEVPCEGFFISFYEAADQLKQVRYVWCEGAEVDASEIAPIRLFETEGANSRAIRTGKSVISTRVLDRLPRGKYQLISTRNATPTVESLVTPMVVMGRTIGTLEVQNHTESYRPEHIVALEMAANLAAVAIENVRLMEIESRARAAAEEANRAKDEFLAILSHELRTPLNAMYGWTQILQSTDLSAAKVRQAVEVIARNVRLQKTLIEDLLDVSRIITGKMQLEAERVSVVSIAQETLEAARPAAEKKQLALELRIHARRDEINGDRHRLQQVVGNLLTNAVKFTPTGGRVEVAIESAAPDRLKLTVSDTGIGIAPELLPHIFDRFRQADVGSKRKYGGLGLGLTIVKHLTEMHGGTVAAESPGEGSGARFVVTLPLVETFHYDGETNEDAAFSAENTDETGAYQTNGSSARLAGVRILLVDDDRDVLDLMSFALGQEGAATGVAQSVGAALEKLAEEHFDLLISDLGMPEQDGFDLIKAVRSQKAKKIRQLPAIALTGYVSAQDKERVIQAGFETHLPKPVDLDNLTNVICELISGEQLEAEND